jgi:hypothetical protein
MMNAGDLKVRMSCIRSIVDGIEVDDDVIRIVGQEGRAPSRDRRQKQRRRPSWWFCTQMASQRSFVHCPTPAWTMLFDEHYLQSPCPKGMKTLLSFGL